MDEPKVQISEAARCEAEVRLGKAAMDRVNFDMAVGLFKVFNSEKMKDIKHIELTRNMETGEVKRKNGKTVTEEMLSAIAALDLCKRGVYHDGVGGWVESSVLSLRWYSVVVNKRENENV